MSAQIASDAQARASLAARVVLRPSQTFLVLALAEGASLPSRNGRVGWIETQDRCVSCAVRVRAIDVAGRVRVWCQPRAPLAAVSGERVVLHVG